MVTIKGGGELLLYYTPEQRTRALTIKVIEQPSTGTDIAWCTSDPHPLCMQMVQHCFQLCHGSDKRVWYTSSLASHGKEDTLVPAVESLSRLSKTAQGHKRHFILNLLYLST